MGEKLDPATIAELQAMESAGASSVRPKLGSARKPRANAVPPSIIAELERVEAAGMSAVDTSAPAYKAKVALANAQKAHERGFTDHLANAGKSFVGALASIAPDVLQFAGSASAYLGAQNVGEAIQQSGAYLAREIDEAFGVEDPTLVDKFASAGGFMLGLLLPGSKVARAGQLLSRGAPRAVQGLATAILGGAGAGALEAAAEAGDQVERKVREGMDPDQAFEDAWRAFGPNVAGSTITNLPLFSGLGRIAKASVEALTEGGQEMYQGWLDQWVMDGAEGGFARGFGKTVQENWDTQWEAGGIGGTVGFVAGLILGRKTGRSFDESLAEKGGDEAGRRVAKLRDDAAEMSNEDLIQAISQIQAEALGGAAAPQAIEHYGVLMEEASYRLGDQAIRAQSTSKLKDMARHFDENAPNLNPSQQGVYAFTVTELYARGEISKAEAAIHLQKIGIPEGRVDLDKIETRETQQVATRVKPLRGRWVVENIDTGEALASFDNHADAVMHMEGLQRGSVSHGGAEAARRSPQPRDPAAPEAQGGPVAGPGGATVASPSSSGALAGDLRDLAKLGDLIHNFPNPRVGHLIWRNPDGTWSVVNATEGGSVAGVFDTQQEAIDAVENEPYFIPNERWMEYYNNLWKTPVEGGQGQVAQEERTEVGEGAQAPQDTEGAGQATREVQAPPARRQLPAPQPGQQTAEAEEAIEGQPPAGEAAPQSWAEFKETQRGSGKSGLKPVSYFQDLIRNFDPVLSDLVPYILGDPITLPDEPGTQPTGGIASPEDMVSYQEAVDKIIEWVESKPSTIPTGLAEVAEFTQMLAFARPLGERSGPLTEAEQALYIRVFQEKVPGAGPGWPQTIIETAHSDRLSEAPLRIWRLTKQVEGYFKADAKGKYDQMRQQGMVPKREGVPATAEDFSPLPPPEGGKWTEKEKAAARQVAELARRFGEALGIDIQFYYSRKSDKAGFAIREYNSIWINLQAQETRQSPQYVIAHEIFHALHYQYPAEFQQVLEDIKGRVPERMRRSLGRLGYTADGMDTEVAARLLDHRAQGAEFWSAVVDRLGPRKTRSFLQKIQKALGDALRAVRTRYLSRASLQGAQGMEEVETEVIDKVQERILDMIEKQLELTGEAQQARESAAGLAESLIGRESKQAESIQESAREDLDSWISRGQEAVQSRETKSGLVRKGGRRAKALAMGPYMDASMIATSGITNMRQLRSLRQRLEKLAFQADYTGNAHLVAQQIKEFLESRGEAIHQQTANREARAQRAQDVVDGTLRMREGKPLSKKHAKAILKDTRGELPSRFVDYIVDELYQQAIRFGGRGRTNRPKINPHSVKLIAVHNDYSHMTALRTQNDTAVKMDQKWEDVPLDELRRINEQAAESIEENVRAQGGKAADRFFLGQGNILPSSVSPELYAAYEMSLAELSHRNADPYGWEGRGAEAQGGQGGPVFGEDVDVSKDVPFYIRDPRPEPTEAMDGRDVTLGTMFGGSQDILANAARRAGDASKKAVLKAEKAFAGRDVVRRPDDGPAMTESLDLLVQARKNAARRAAVSEKWQLGYWDKLYKTHVDDLHGLKVVLDKGFREVGLPTIDEMPMLESAYHTLRGVVRSWNAFADRFIQGGVRKFTNPNEMLSDRGLGEIMNDEKYEIANNYDQFGEYLKAKRFVAMGKEQRYAKRLGTPEARKRLRLSQAVVQEAEAKHPAWAEAAGELHNYANGLLDYLVDTEMMTAEEAARIKESADFYVPMNIAPDLRNPGAFSTSPGKGILQHKPVNEFKRLVEGHEISHPLESLAAATYQMVNAAHMNMGRRRVAQAVAEITSIDPELAPYMGEILTVDDFRQPMTRTRGELEAAAGTKRRRRSAVRRKLKEWEVDEDTIQEVLEAFDDAGDVIGNQHKKLWYVQLELKNNMVAYFDKGEFKILKMNNPDMYEAFHAMTEKQHNAVLSMTGKLTRMLRSGVVLGPEFAVRNPIRDIFSASVLAGKAIRTPADAVRFLGHWGKGLAAAMRQNELYDQWVMSGGANADLVALDRETMGLRVRRQLLRGKKRGFAKFLAQHPLTAMRAFSGMTEAATRVAVFRAELKANLADGLPMREAQVRAGMESREASVDFSRRGDFGATMNQLQPFYNAALQGTDKLVRALVRGSPAQRRAAAIRATVLVTVPSLIHSALFGDDEWHKRLPRYQKNMYWNFNLDGKNPHGRILRIPKPFELGMIFGALPERLIEYIRKNDPHAVDGWLAQFVDVTAPLKLSEVVPPVVAFYNASRNWDDFRNSEIVKGQLQKLPGNLQYTPSTSPAARALGAALPGDISPLKIDFYVRSAFGGVGQIAADIASAGVSLVKPSMAEHRMGGQTVAGPITDSWPVVRGFIEAGPHAFDTNSQDFYSHLDEATTAFTLYNRARRGLIPPDAMARELADRLHWLALYKPLSKISRDVSKMTGGIKTLQAMPDATLSDEEKRESVNSLIEARAQLYQSAAEQTRKILYDDELMRQLEEAGQKMVEQLTE
jgi:hypothetical protein